MEPTGVSDWLWEGKGEGELRTMASAGLGQLGGSICREQTHRENRSRRESLSF